jgi:hypothetical protein
LRTAFQTHVEHPLQPIEDCRGEQEPQETKIMNPQNPKQTQPGPGQKQQQGSKPDERRGQQPSPQQPKSPPRYDDRPQPGTKSDREAVQREENEGPAGSTTKRPNDATGDSAKKKTGTGGLPHYGDQEPNDPRRSDVEGDEPDSAEAEH